MKVKIINKPMLCWNNDESNAKEYHVLAKVDNDTYPYKVIGNENSPTLSSSLSVFSNAKTLSDVKPRTIKDGLEEGDFIENNEFKREVLGVCGKLVFTSSFPHCFVPFALQELINEGYKLVQPESKEEDLVGLTIQDISDGKGVGIDPKLIRIKE